MTDYDVAILGLGPVGCTAALLMAEAGLKVAAIERDERVYQLPRAVNLDGEIIRALQKVGRGQTVQDMMQSVRPGDRAGFANSKREWLFGQDTANFGSNGWQPANMFDQPQLETYLREQAIGHANVDAFIGCEAGTPKVAPDSVAITFTSNATNSTQSIQASYLIACDGASSSTRKAFDIAWTDLGYDHHWLVVDVIAKEGHRLNNSTMQVCDPDRISTYVCTKDPFRRWEFKMHAHETAEQMLEEETIAALIDPWTPRGTYELRRKAVYQFHAGTADQWRVGRVFIAGDAAHQTPPFLGQGMNTGLRDVINLSWKLPMVIAGVAGDSLLDTYFAERNAHAHDMVEWAVAIGRLMEHLAEKERCARAALPEPPTPAKLQSSGYGQGREQPPIRDGVVLLEQVSDTGSTGYLFSQPIVQYQGGEPFRLDQLLGPGFAIVFADADDAKELLSDGSHAVLQHLGANIVHLNELKLVKGHFDRLFGAHQAAIVRPDRLVFGHTNNNMTPNDLVAALVEKLTLTNV